MACGTELPEVALYCTQCGVHLETGARANGDSPDSAVFPLLAAANLARMRGQWDTAEQRCLEVLRHAPPTPLPTAAGISMPARAAGPTPPSGMSALSP